MKWIEFIVGILISLAVAGAVLIGCRPTPVSGGQGNVAGTSWVLVEIEGTDASSLFGGEGARLRFASEEQRVTGQGGCNTFNGFYSISEVGITFGELVTTRAVCPESEEEERFLRLLRVADEAELSQTSLQLRQGNVPLLRFVREDSGQV